MQFLFRVGVDDAVSKRHFWLLVFSYFVKACESDFIFCMGRAYRFLFS